MSAIEIKRGTFQLTRSVENPKPNKRNTRDWTCAAEWTGGTYFIIEDWWGSELDKPLACIRTQHRDSKDIMETDERFWLIARHLVPVTETPSDYLARIHQTDSARDVLDHLASIGRIGLADVELAMATLIEVWNKEDKEAIARQDAKRSAEQGEK